MLTPGPDHPITITTNGKGVRVTLGGQVIAESTKALRLQESDYPVVFYLPSADVRTELLIPTPHVTRCPYKGQATHFTVRVDGSENENAVWSYEKPFPAVQEIAGLLAFYRSRVDSISEF